MKNGKVRVRRGEKDAESDGFREVNTECEKERVVGCEKTGKKGEFFIQGEIFDKSECFFLGEDLKKEGKGESFGLGSFGNSRVVGKMRVISDSDEKIIKINELLPEKNLRWGVLEM